MAHQLRDHPVLKADPMKKIDGTKTEWCKHAKPDGKRRANKQHRRWIKRRLRLDQKTQASDNDSSAGSSSGFQSPHQA